MNKIGNSSPSNYVSRTCAATTVKVMTVPKEHKATAPK